MQIETAYRLYFLRQVFEKWSNQAVFSAKNMHNGALMKNRLNFLRKIVLRKKPTLPQKCTSRQAIECIFWDKFSKNGQIKLFSRPKICTMVLWWINWQSFIKKSYFNKTFLASKFQIKTGYRLYPSKQIYEKRIQAVFSIKNVNNAALMKNRTKLHQ